MLWVQRSMAALIEGSPHVSTNTTSSRYGSHPTNTSPIECLEAVRVAGLSPSRRMMVLGVHTLSTITITTMHVSELMMSVSSGPRLFET